MAHRLTQLTGVMNVEDTPGLVSCREAGRHNLESFQRPDYIADMGSDRFYA